MAKSFFGNPFKGEVQMVGRFKAFSIGPESDFDQVRVDNRLVAAGRVLELDAENPVVTYVRGPRAAFIDTNINHVDYEVAAPNAHVIAYECKDQVVNPGPRPPRSHKFRKRNVTGDATHINEIIVPFAGRRHLRALLTALSTSGAAVTTKFCLMGRLWLAQDDAAPAGQQGTATVGGYASGATAGGKPLVYVELDGCGTIAAPLTTAVTAPVWTGGPDKAPVATSATVTNGKHVGGTNDAEYYDELALIYWSSASTLDLAVDIEVAGEEGCA